jgi:hypothetical protein
MVLKYHPVCDWLLGQYMRLIYLSPKDDIETKEIYYREARSAWNELINICKEHYRRLGETDADIICLSLDIYKLHDICCEYFK